MNREQKHGMSGVFVFVLLGLFAIMSIFMVLLGSQMYRNTIHDTETNRRDRILSSYLRSMVRYGDQKGGVLVESFDGIDTITLRESFDEEAYVTRLYVYEGKLYEQFARERYDFEPDMGEEICAASSLHAELNGNLLTISAEDADGESRDIRIYLTCAR